MILTLKTIHVLQGDRCQESAGFLLSRFTIFVHFLSNDQMKSQKKRKEKKVQQ